MNKNLSIFFWVLIIFLFQKPFLFSQELGRLSLTYQNQFHKTFLQGSDYSSSLNSLYLNLWQSLGNKGYLGISINYYVGQEMNQISSYNLELKDISLGKFTLDTDFGYSSYILSSLSSFGSFNPAGYGGLKGGKIALRSKKTDVYLFGGKLYGTSGNGVQNSQVYGARGVFRLNPAWTLGIGWMKLLDFPIHGSNYEIADYDIISIDSAVLIKSGIYMLGDFRYAFNSREDQGNEYYLKTGPYINWEKLSLELYYSYASSNFPQIGTLSVHDKKGYNIIGQYRPFQNFSFFLSLDTFNDNLERLLNIPMNTFMTTSFGASYSPSGFWPQFSFNYNRSQREVEIAEEVAEDSKSNLEMIFLSLSKQYRKFYWVLQFSKGEFGGSEDQSQDYDFQQCHLNIRRTLIGSNYLFLNGYCNQREGKANTLNNRNLGVQLGGHFSLQSNLRLNLQLLYSNSRNELIDQDTRNIGGVVGIEFNISPLKLNGMLSYRYSGVEGSILGDTGRYYHQVFVSLNREFTWGRREGGVRRGIFSRSSKIRGRVFVDVNQNNICDPDEKSLENIRIMMDGRIVGRTNSRGYYKLSSVLPGAHKLSLNLRNVPAFYEPAKDKVPVNVPKGKTLNVNLPVVPVGFLSGQLLLDKNENKKKDEKDTYLAGIPVNLISNGEVIRTEFTNSKGMFTFDNVRPGEYTFEIEEFEIKGKYQKIVDYPKVKVAPWQEIKGITLLLGKFKKTRIKKILDY